MHHIRQLTDLRLDDPVMTPNGMGFYQGRCYNFKTITHLIVCHELDCMAPGQTGIAFPPGETTAVRLYPIGDITL